MLLIRIRCCLRKCSGLGEDGGEDTMHNSINEMNFLHREGQIMDHYPSLFITKHFFGVMLHLLPFLFRICI